jgi:hypothetical protein
VLNKRRIVIDVGRGGWTGWVLLALMAVPLVLLLFFFAAILIPIALILLLVGGARFYWLMHKARQSSGPIDIAPDADYGANSPNDADASPPKQLPPPSA